MTISVRISNDEETEKSKVQILCVDISNYSQTAQFFICSFAVFIFFLLYGYMQELIFTLEGFQPYGWYLTLVQFAYYTVFGMIEKCIRNISTRRLVNSFKRSCINCLMIIYVLEYL